MAYVTLVFVLLVAAAMCVAAVSYLTALNLLRPPRMEDGKALHVLKRLSPEDLGLSFEPIVFDVNDVAADRPLRIAAWWIPATGADRTVILLHGFADAKVGSIAWAPTWHALGWNVLAVDLRAHGESGGTQCTAGYFERHDVRQVIDQLRTDRPEQAKKIALFGVSLGAAVAIAAAEGRNDLAAVVVDSPFATFGQAAAMLAERLGVPLAFTRPWAIRLAERISAARYGQVEPIRLAPTLLCPVLVIHGDADETVGPVVRAQYAAIRRPNYRHVVFPGATHNLALQTDPARYAQVLSDFLSAAE